MFGLRAVILLMTHAVLVGVLQIVAGQMAFTLGRFITQQRVQANSRVLVQQVFRVFEGKIAEGALVESQLAIESGNHPLMCGGQRQRIRAEGASIVAEYISRDLIAQQDEGQHAAR